MSAELYPDWRTRNADNPVDVTRNLDLANVPSSVRYLRVSSFLDAYPHDRNRHAGQDCGIGIVKGRKEVRHRSEEAVRLE